MRHNPTTIGAQGYAIGVTCFGAEITDITTSGTVSADVADDPPGLRSGGFERTGLTSGSQGGSECEGESGATSVVVLSPDFSASLPNEGV